MSRILSIALIALYALTLSQAYVPQVNYWMNRDFIAANLCENKDRPELKCEGKCHLKKEIQGTADDQHDGQEVSVRLMVEFVQPAVGFQFKPQIGTAKVDFPFHSDRLVSGCDPSIFHPPQA